MDQRAARRLLEVVKQRFLPRVLTQDEYEAASKHQGVVLHGAVENALFGTGKDCTRCWQMSLIVAQGCGGEAKSIKVRQVQRDSPEFEFSYKDEQKILSMEDADSMIRALRNMDLQLRSVDEPVRKPRGDLQKMARMIEEDARERAARALEKEAKAVARTDSRGRPLPTLEQLQQKNMETELRISERLKRDQAKPRDIQPLELFFNYEFRSGFIDSIAHRVDGLFSLKVPEYDADSPYNMGDIKMFCGKPMARAIYRRNFMLRDPYPVLNTAFVYACAKEDLSSLRFEAHGKVDDRVHYPLIDNFTRAQVDNNHLKILLHIQALFHADYKKRFESRTLIIRSFEEHCSPKSLAFHLRFDCLPRLTVALYDRSLVVDVVPVGSYWIFWKNGVLMEYHHTSWQDYKHLSTIFCTIANVLGMPYETPEHERPPPSPTPAELYAEPQEKKDARSYVDSCFRGSADNCWGESNSLNEDLVSSAGVGPLSQSLCADKADQAGQSLCADKADPPEEKQPQENEADENREFTTKELQDMGYNIFQEDSDVSDTERRKCRRLSKFNKKFEGELLLVQKYFHKEYVNGGFDDSGRDDSGSDDSGSDDGKSDDGKSDAEVPNNPEDVEDDGENYNSQRF